MKRLVPAVVLALASVIPLLASAQNPPPPTSVPAQAGKQAPRDFRPRQPPPVQPSGFDTRGWHLLGEQTVDSRNDRDSIRVSGNARYSDLTLVVEDGNLEMIEFSVLFGDTTRFAPNVRQHFRDGSRTRVIDLPRESRIIKQIDLRYANVTPGARPRVQVWGRLAANAPAPAPVPPPMSSFDSRGWTKIGDRDLRPGANRDALRLNKINASFTKLALVVEGGDAPITGVNIEFGNGQRYSPMMTAVVGEAARVRVIELPSEMRQIRRVQFNYGPITVGRPRVELWGKNEPVAQPPKPSGFNPAGWTFLGEKRVDGWSDKDTIKVPRQFGRFSKLVVVVEDSDLELDDFVVNYGRGQKFQPQLNQVFRDGQRSRVIDLPDVAQGIKQIHIRYRNLPGDATPARLQVWAKDESYTQPPAQPQWDSRGWVPLGALNVDPSTTQQTMTGIGRGRFKQLTIVVTHAVFDIESVTMTLPTGRTGMHRLSGRVTEGAGRVITVDVPRSELLTSLTFKWGRNRGNGQARIEVYGLPDTNPPPAQ
jgi:hypothetical protein